MYVITKTEWNLDSSLKQDALLNSSVKKMKDLEMDSSEEQKHTHRLFLIDQRLRCQ